MVVFRYVGQVLLLIILTVAGQNSALANELCEDLLEQPRPVAAYLPSPLPQRWLPVIDHFRYRTDLKALADYQGFYADINGLLRFYPFVDRRGGKLTADSMDDVVERIRRIDEIMRLSRAKVGRYYRGEVRKTVDLPVAGMRYTERGYSSASAKLKIGLDFAGARTGGDGQPTTTNRGRGGIPVLNVIDVGEDVPAIYLPKMVRNFRGESELLIHRDAEFLVTSARWEILDGKTVFAVRSVVVR